MEPLTNSLDCINAHVRTYVRRRKIGGCWYRWLGRPDKIRRIERRAIFLKRLDLSSAVNAKAVKGGGKTRIIRMNGNVIHESRSLCARTMHSFRDLPRY